MALVKFPEGQQRSGKQGGIVWSRNRFGAYARNRAVPVNPDSAKQRAVRTAFAQNARSWSGLNQYSRDMWTAMAANLPKQNRLGDTIFLTGSQTFQSSNQALLPFGLYLQEPGYTVPSPFPTDVILGASPNIILDCTAGDTPPNYGIVIEATRAVSRGVTSGTVKSSYKQITTVPADTTLGAQLNLADVWTDVFGTRPIDGKVFIRFQWVSYDTGQTSGWVVVESLLQ